MTPELRPITKLTVASTTALFLLAAPLAVDWRTLDIDAVRAEAKNDGGGNGGDGGGLGGAVNGAVGAAGGAVDGAADAVGGAVGAVGGAVADGVSDAAGSDSGSGGAGSGSGDAGSDAGSGEADGGAGSGAADSGSAPAEASGDAASADPSGGAAPTDATDSAAPADSAATDADGVAESGETAAIGDVDATSGVVDAVSGAVAPAAEAVDGLADAAAGTAPAAAADAAVVSSPDASVTAPAGTADKVAVSRTRVTVSIQTIRFRSTGGDGGDKHRLVAAPAGAATTTVALPPEDGAAAGLAAIEPSAGPVLPTAPSANSAAARCAADDGRPQGTEISCFVAGSEGEIRTRQIAYAPPGATVDGRTTEPATDGMLAPSSDQTPGGPSFYDELYGLQQVEARRYADGGMPRLIVQGIVSNMSDGERSVPPLLAIVQDDQGKELMRWTFRAEAETLDPGGSTGFRSEMFDAGSESARVTIVFAAEQQTMQ